ncbi:hypothetical protein XBJ2_880003 [Xenorhabdus bovienii str. Jollieti]|uniref:Uncharacterized protein n=1 Tax=Xenorhabdus bovienii (strain SS-2004) TaxID=406818 RepID=D3V106_XENBS|nr:hypothetical protein XBJ1_1712 [Xenorhabdus bovienii SS-2004]CDH30546.1 hypothetical protein XBJ2_880003 [Xenorhabdus bovienii str. Jollieti]
MPNKIRLYIKTGLLKILNIDLSYFLLEKLSHILISRYLFTPHLYYIHFNYMEKCEL